MNCPLFLRVLSLHQLKILAQVSCIYITPECFLNVITVLLACIHDVTWVHRYWKSSSADFRVHHLFNAVFEIEPKSKNKNKILKSMLVKVYIIANFCIFYCSLFLLLVNSINHAILLVLWWLKISPLTKGFTAAVLYWECPSFITNTHGSMAMWFDLLSWKTKCIYFWYKQCISIFKTWCVKQIYYCKYIYGDRISFDFHSCLLMIAKGWSVSSSNFYCVT